MSEITVSELRVRPASPEDIEAVSGIEESCFKDPYPAYFIAQLFEANPDTFLVASVDGIVVGYAVVDRWIDHNHLVSIAVRPQNRRKGVGSRLLIALEERMETGRPVKLEVRKSNLAASELYRKYGYKETGIDKRYYSDGEDALVMEKA